MNRIQLQGYNGRLLIKKDKLMEILKKEYNVEIDEFIDNCTYNDVEQITSKLDVEYINSSEELKNLSNDKFLVKNKFDGIIQNDYEWLSSEIEKLEKLNQNFSVFTALDYDGDEIGLVNGIYEINRLGYIVIKGNYLLRDRIIL